MRKTLRKSLSVFISVLLLFGTLAFALPMVSAEPGTGDMEGVTEITLDTPTLVTVEAGLTACLKFTPAANGDYTLTSPDMTINFGISVYDSSNNYVGASSGEGNNFACTFFLAGGETYYLQITSYSENDCTFHAVIKTVSDFLASVATPIAQNETKEVTTGSDNIFIAFSPETSGVYVLSGTNEASVNGALYNSSLYELSYSYGAPLVMRASLDAGNTYYYRVYSSNAQTFDVTVQRWADQVAAVATPLTLDVAQEVTLDSDGSYTWLSFTPAASGEYVFSADNQSWFNFNLYDSSMNYGYSETINDTPRAYRLYDLSAGETYYFRLETYGSAEPFNVKVQSVGSYIAELPVVSLTKGVAAEIHMASNYQKSWISFTPTESGDYTLSADNTVYVNAGYCFSNPPSFNTFSTLPMVCNMTLEAGTTYYFTLSGYDEQTFNVTIQTTEEYVANMHPIIMTEGEAQSITLSDSGDKVLLQFTPGNSGYYVFDGTNTNNISFAAYTSSFSSAYSNYISGVPSVNYVAMDRGETYYIMLSSTTTQTFDMTVNTAADFLAGRNATVLTQNVAQELTVTGNYENPVWLKFTPVESGAYMLSCTNESYLSTSCFT